MSAPLLNYSTTVAVERSIAEVHRLLVAGESTSRTGGSSMSQPIRAVSSRLPLFHEDERRAR